MRGGAGDFDTFSRVCSENLEEGWLAVGAAGLQQVLFGKRNELVRAKRWKSGLAIAQWLTPAYSGVAASAGFSFHRFCFLFGGEEIQIIRINRTRDGVCIVLPVRRGS